MSSKRVGRPPVVFVTARGERKTITEWARELGVCRATLQARLSPRTQVVLAEERIAQIDGALRKLEEKRVKLLEERQGVTRRIVRLLSPPPPPPPTPQPTSPPPPTEREREVLAFLAIPRFLREITDIATARDLRARGLVQDDHGVWRATDPVIGGPR